MKSSTEAFLPSAGFLPSAVPRRAANPRYPCARRQTATVAGWMPMAPNARHREWSADARLASHLHRMREETTDRGRVDRLDIRIAGNCCSSRACPFDCREGKGIFRKSKQSRGDKYECIVHICITLSDNRESSMKLMRVGQPAVKTCDPRRGRKSPRSVCSCQRHRR